LDPLEKDFGGTGIPTTFVIDRRGKIVARHSGFAPKESFIAMKILGLAKMRGDRYAFEEPRPERVAKPR